MQGRFVVTLDADLQNDPADIPTMVAELTDYDVVCGIRANRHDVWVRKISSRIANGIRNRLTGDSITDVGCSLRIMRSEMLSRIPVFDGMHRFLPTLLKMAGARVVEIAVNHRSRTRGQSKYGIGNRAWRGLMDLMGVRWLQRRHVDLTAFKELDPSSSAAVSARESGLESDSEAFES